jgi:plastocyanin
VRRTLVMLTLLTALGMLAAGCGGSGSSGGYGAGGGASSATTAAQSETSSAGGAYGGGYGQSQTTSVATSATGTAVAINDFAFSPSTLKLKVGQQVTWTNKQQGVAHTVTADGGAFDHPMPPGAKFSFSFAKAGTFAYHCSIHRSMHGTVVVS